MTVYESNRGRIIYHEEREQPFTVWVRGKVERFERTYDEAVNYLGAHW